MNKTIGWKQFITLPSLLALLIALMSLTSTSTAETAANDHELVSLAKSPDPLAILLSDIEFARPAGDWDIQAFLDAQPGPLKTLAFDNDGYDVPASRTLEFYSEFEAVNARVLLTLLELKCHLLSDPAAGEQTLRYAMGNNDPAFSGFQAQLRWAVSELNKGFYDRYYGEDQEQIVLEDGTVIYTPYKTNAATFAIQRFLALETTAEQWAVWVSDTPDGFYATYARLFGAPEMSPAHAPVSVAGMSGLRLPWGNSETWYYTAGPHGSFAGGVLYPKAAVDFAPGGGTGCRDTDAWVRAAASGTVTYADCNFVRIDHGGGWATGYLHLVDLQVRRNQYVTAGTPLGHSSCEWGRSCDWPRPTRLPDGSHVHMDTRINNISQPIDGTNLGGWTVHEGSSDYNGTMTNGNIVKVADVRHTSQNEIRAYPNDTDSDDGRTLASGQMVYGTRSPGSDEDVYYINGTSGQVLTVEMWKTSASSLDTLVYVRDPNDQDVGLDDDGGTDLNSLLVVTLQSSGRFRIHAKGYSTSTGAYALKATLSSGGGSDTEDGRWLHHDRAYRGILNSNSDNDIFYFMGSAGRIVSIRMWKDGSNVDSYLELYSPSGNRIALNDDGGGNRDSWLVVALPSGGVHRVKARSYNHASSGGYQIRLRMVDANNLAHNGSVWASSVESGNYMPGKAVDGNRNTRWSSSFRDRQLIYVDLGADRRVDMVTLHWERAYAKVYGVYYWTGSYWRNVYWTTQGNGGADIIRFAPITARYILVYGYERGTQWGISLWEFGVYNSIQATPPTVDPEDPSKTPDSIATDPPPPATSPGKDEIEMALIVGEGGYQEFTPQEDTWPGETPDEARQDDAGTPVAVIESIYSDYMQPPEAEQDFEFLGIAEDTDSEGEGDPIVAYEWRSNLDGLLSTQATFTTTARLLSSDIHTITFRAMDNEGVWSPTDARQLTVESQHRVCMPLVIRP